MNSTCMPQRHCPPSHCHFLLEQVCTKLARGGPNNATYAVGYTIMDREHVANVGIDETGTQLTGMRLCLLCTGRNLKLRIELLCKLWRLLRSTKSVQLTHNFCVAVQVDGKVLTLDPTVHTTALVQNWQFPSQDGNSLNVSWERYDSYHAAPQINFTASKRNTAHVLL